MSSKKSEALDTRPVFLCKSPLALIILCSMLICRVVYIYFPPVNSAYLLFTLFFSYIAYAAFFFFFFVALNVPTLRQTVFYFIVKGVMVSLAWLVLMMINIMGYVVARGGQAGTRANEAVVMILFWRELT